MPSQRHIGDTSSDALLDAAREAILDVGWSRMTLTDVARRAGVSRMTIYRRWTDTQALLADLLTREWTELTARVAARLSTDGPAIDAVADGVVASVRAVRRDPLMSRVIERDPELLLPYLLERRGRSQEQAVTALEAQIRAGQADGSIRDGSARLLARSVFLASYGFALSAHTMLPGTKPRSTRVPSYDAELRTLVHRYLSPTPGAP